MGDLHSVSYLDDVGPYFILGHCFFFFDMLVLVGINFSRRPFPPQLMLWSREWPSRVPAASLGSEKHDGCQSHTTTCHYLYQRRGCFGKILTVSFLKSSSLPLLIFLIICENLALGSFTHPHAGKTLEPTACPQYTVVLCFLQVLWRNPCYRSMSCGITDIFLNLRWYQDAALENVKVLLFWEVPVLEVLQHFKVKWNLLLFSCFVGPYLQ